MNPIYIYIYIILYAYHTQNISIIYAVYAHSTDTTILFTDWYNILCAHEDLCYYTHHKKTVIDNNGYGKYVR
jgi:hypothetical protein